MVHEATNGLVFYFLDSYSDYTCDPKPTGRDDKWVLNCNQCPNIIDIVEIARLEDRKEDHLLLGRIIRLSDLLSKKIILSLFSSILSQLHL